MPYCNGVGSDAKRRLAECAQLRTAIIIQPLMKVGEQVVGDLLFCFRLSGGDAVAFVVDHADGQQIGFYFSRCACGKLSSFRAIVISC